MYRLSWDAPGERFYEYGCDRGVLYVNGGDGVAWNGLISVAQSPVGGEPQSFYIDGYKYLTISDPEDFEGTITAFYSPPEFDVCDGSLPLAPGMFVHQQMRQTFGFSYRTRIGSDVDPNSKHYKIHIVYNAVASPSETTFVSLSGDPNLSPLSWHFSTTPVHSESSPPGSHYTIDSTVMNRTVLRKLETILYGTDTEPARLPTPDELVDFLTNLAVYETAIYTNSRYS